MVQDLCSVWRIFGLGKGLRAGASPQAGVGRRTQMVSANLITSIQMRVNDLGQERPELRIKWAKQRRKIARGWNEEEGKELLELLWTKNKELGIRKFLEKIGNAL